MDSNERGLGLTSVKRPKPIVKRDKVTEPTEDTAELSNEDILLKSKQVVHKQLINLENHYNEVKENDTLWIPLKNVPSNGKVFNSNNTVYYKKYTFGDFEDINNNDITLKDQYVLALSGIKCTELESNLLLPFCDFAYICAIRRLEAQGTEKFFVPYTCPSCKQIGTFEFSLDQIGFDTCEKDLPLKVKFKTYPDEVFEFSLYTIGDVLNLMERDLYYRKKHDGSYLVDVTGSYIPDSLRLLSCSCISHNSDEIYNKLLNVHHKIDYNTIKQLINILEFRIQPFEFNCTLDIPKEDVNIDEENDKKLQLLVDNNGKLPPLLEYMKKKQSSTTCGYKNTLNILGGDVLILPFHEVEDTDEYGILS